MRQACIRKPEKLKFQKRHKPVQNNCIYAFVFEDLRNEWAHSHTHTHTASHIHMFFIKFYFNFSTWWSWTFSLMRLWVLAKVPWLPILCAATLVCIATMQNIYIWSICLFYAQLLLRLLCDYIPNPSPAQCMWMCAAPTLPVCYTIRHFAFVCGSILCGVSFSMVFIVHISHQQQ